MSSNKQIVRFVGGPKDGKEEFIVINGSKFRVMVNPDFAFNITESTPEYKDFTDEYYVYDLHRIVCGGATIFYAFQEKGDPKYMMTSIWRGYQRLVENI